MNLDNKSQLLKKAAIGLAILCVIYLVMHPHKSNTPSPPPPVVIIQKPKLMEVTEYITQTGNTVAYNSVDLVARVDGYLDSQKFVDGTYVKKGQELFVIEPEPYYEQLKAAEATVAAQKAAYAYAKTEYERQQLMYKQNATSLKSVEKWASKKDEAKAEIDKAEADAKNAAITYSYTHVLAPFDGRIGRHLVDPGNLVGNGTATKLATIEQIKPIYVYIYLNELDLLKIRAAAKKRGLKASSLPKVPVFVGLQSETDFPHKGSLDFVNTGLNSSTGTMEFRALLENAQLDLVPGLFVNVRIPVSEPSKKLTIPDTSIQYDQIGAYVLTVDSNNYVVLKRIETGSLNNGMRAVLKGIDPQDNIIVSGLQNATPSHLVSPKTQNDGLQKKN
ncbi:efflux RND transporter periplasmic adaptor subunit [Legionella sp. km535]|uniref:efflux RND transporter periplasmic adaptor subunit n=1 Tax=Legionella sp. km535 TaxID=2498107 RepID=UPI000F8E25C9|nr:efflux RND transporter periplasmic adaptor subunit [Legionella sp. km535]RUR17751.1 efflux RND transporter periplasmic adaptor subunit [Legionella sp. km535]